MFAHSSPTVATTHHHLAGLRCRVLQLFGMQDDVAEAALGLLAAMTLRAPNIAAVAAEAGAIDALVEVLADAPRRAGGKAAGSKGGSDAAGGVIASAAVEADAFHLLIAPLLREGHLDQVRLRLCHADTLAQMHAVARSMCAGAAAAARQACMATRNMVRRHVLGETSLVQGQCRDPSHQVRRLLSQRHCLRAVHAAGCAQPRTAPLLPGQGR
jgi:hypothetical protein